MGLTGKPGHELEKIQAQKSDAEINQERIRAAYKAILDTKHWIEKFLAAFQERDHDEVQRLWNFKDVILEQFTDALDHLKRVVQSDALKRAGHNRDQE